jgi:hypothetical protein
MMDAANALTARWRGKDGTTIDVAAEASRLTLDVLERTIFSDGFGRDAEELRDAMGVYFNTIGKIDPLDLIGLPPSVPRLSHLRVRSTLRFFESAIDAGASMASPATRPTISSRSSSARSIRKPAGA